MIVKLQNNPSRDIIGSAVADSSEVSNLLHDSDIRVDPYMCSPAYVMMTGRKNLYVYSGQFENILYAEHPNLSETGIIFPPSKESGWFDVLQLKKKIIKIWPNIQVIRVPICNSRYGATILRGEVVRESVLDYSFPVRVIDCKAVVLMQGHDFYNFKKTFNKLDKENISAKLIDLEIDKKCLMNILRQWGKEVLFNPDTNIADPSLYVIESLFKSLDLQGLIFHRGKDPIAFTIWEMPKDDSNIANAVVHCALHDKGLSEFVHYKMACSVLAQGVEKICIGGAETEGLDFFKRKMNPVESIELVTIQL